VSFARAALLAVAALALGWYLASTAAGFADWGCWASSLTPWPLGPSCSG
jgi:hypothetical protein